MNVLQICFYFSSFSDFFQEAHRILTLSTFYVRIASQYLNIFNPYLLEEIWMTKIKVIRVSTLLQNGSNKEAIIEGFVKVNKAAWPPPVPERYLWTEEKVNAQIQNCPHLLFCAF